MKVLSTEGVENVERRLRICADIEAARMEGSKVECNRIDLPDEQWKQVSTPSYYFHVFDYRIRPEPAVLYGLRKSDGSMALCVDGSGPWVSESPAVAHKAKTVIERQAGDGLSLVAFVEKLG